MDATRTELTDEIIATMDAALSSRKSMMERTIKADHRPPSKQESAELEMIARAQEWLLREQLAGIHV